LVHHVEIDHVEINDLEIDHVEIDDLKIEEPFSSATIPYLKFPRRLEIEDVEIEDNLF